MAVEAIELKLTKALATIVSPIKIFEMPSELVARIAGESAENRALREQLKKKMQVLANGLVICRQFAGNRGVGTNKPNEKSHITDNTGRAQSPRFAANKLDQE